MDRNGKASGNGGGANGMESLLPVKWLKHHATATPVVEVAAEAVA